jgi:hypothetical protein
VPINGTTAGEPEAFFDGEFGRVRRVLLAPDGHLWLTTSNTDGDDRVLVLSID